MKRRRKVKDRIEDVLRLMSSRPQLVSLEEGEVYVCSVCNLPVKPCESHPAQVCAAMVQEGTELRLLRGAGRAQERGEYGACLVCGRPFTRRERQSQALREVCPSCQTFTSTRRRKSRRQE